MVQAVILVHGLGRTSRSMRRLAHHLNQQGYQTHCMDYTSRSGDLGRWVAQLQALITSLHNAGAERLHLITHSMGAIVVRATLGQYPDLVVDRVVMLAPPNADSEIVDFWRAGRLRSAVFKYVMGSVGHALHT